MLFERTKVQKDFSKLSKLFYGSAKAGKTSMAACQKDKEGREPLFISTEDGLSALEVYSVRVTTWEGVKKLVGVLKENVEQIRKDHSCIVVDLVSDLDVWCQEYIAKKNNVQHLADLQYGKGFSLSKSEMQGVFRDLFDILPVTFICHSTEKDMHWNGETLKLQAPSLSKACLEYINGKVSLIAWFVPASSKKAMPSLTMKNTLTSIAGSRHRQIAREFQIDPNNPGATMAEIQKIFANERDAVIEEKDNAKKPVTSSPDSAQVATN